MSQLSFRANRVSSHVAIQGDLRVLVDMTEQQMFVALEEIAAQVPETVFRQWVEKLGAEE